MSAGAKEEEGMGARGEALEFEAILLVSLRRRWPVGIEEAGYARMALARRLEEGESAKGGVEREAEALAERLEAAGGERREASASQDGKTIFLLWVAPEEASGAELEWAGAALARAADERGLARSEASLVGAGARAARFPRGPMDSRAARRALESREERERLEATGSGSGPSREKGRRL